VSPPVHVDREDDGRRRQDGDLYRRWQGAVDAAEAAGVSGDYLAVPALAREAKRLREQLGGNPAEPWWYEP
jgi:hypothetical protein